jgi:hemoglobin
MHIKIIAALLALGLTSAIVCADDKSQLPLERAELDKRIVKVVFDATLFGTELYNNKNDTDGCFRIYQGALMVVQPLLDHRPKLAQLVKEKLDRSKLQSPKEGAFALRLVLDEIMNEIAPPQKTETKTDTKTDTKPKTLWERLGGIAGMTKIVHITILNSIEDPKLKTKMIPANKKVDIKGFEQSLIEYISSVTGGPLLYKGKDMKAAHAGMKLTDEDFNAFVGHLEGALNNNKVDPVDIKEFLAIIDKTRAEIVEVKTKN